MDKKYHVLAIGSALVDTEIEVTDDDLKNLEIEKGLMTLVDEDRQSELIDYLNDHLTASKRASGGSAANTIIAVAAFGGETFFCGRVADDDNGRFYLGDMADAGVNIRPVADLPDGITGKCLVLITPDAERSMNTFLGISETLSEADLDLDAISASEYVYIESYLATSDTARAAAARARKHAQANNTRVAVSLSDPGIVAHFRDEIEEITGRRVDLLFCNRDEALTLTGTDNINDATEALFDRADQFAITLGAEGAIVYDGSEIHSIPGRAITAVDTNGAGDMFAGAVLYALTQGRDLRQAAELGCLAAAAVVGQFGPRLPLRQYRGLLAALSG